MNAHVLPVFAQLLDDWFKATPRAYRVTVLGPDGDEVEVCPHCSGLGRLADDVCRACEGSGAAGGEGR